MQEKQAQVLEVFKEMQKQGVFTISPAGTKLNEQVANATTNEDIINLSQEIKRYIKDLDRELTVTSKVPINDVLADFNDLYQLQLHKMYLEPHNAKGNLYETKLDYNTAGIATFAISGTDVTFTLEERKLLKLINHYYISLASQKDFKDKIFYIPINQLKEIIIGKPNRNTMKERLITACKRLSEKVVYWNYTQTKYANAKLSKQKLVVGKEVKLADITLLYSPYDKNGNMELKGLICRINNFLKLRLAMKQITYNFPLTAIKGTYLEFTIVSKTVYLMNYKSSKNRGYVLIPVSDFLKKTNYYKDGINYYENYLSIIWNDEHKPRELEKVIATFISVATYFKYVSMLKTKCTIIVHHKNRGNKVIASSSVDLMRNNKVSRDKEAVYQELERLVSGARKEVQEVNILCAELIKRKISNSATIMDCIKRTNIDKQLLNVYLKDKSGNVDVEDLKNYLIKQIPYTQGKLKDALENIEFKVQFTKV